MQPITTNICLPSPVETIINRQTKRAGIHLLIKRDDLIHPQISGNKWRKLKYNLGDFGQLDLDTIVTFGGAFSNHLLAVAHSGKLLNCNTVGFIRTYQLDKKNPTIRLLTRLGMRIIPVIPNVYESLKSNPSQVWSIIGSKEIYIIPEGGTNERAIKGVGELWDEVNDDQIKIDTFVTTVGTGGTLAGLVQQKPMECQLIGMTLFKDDITSVQGHKYIDNPKLYKFHKCRDGLRFGKVDQDLVGFINKFSNDHGILLDPIYTGRAMRTMLELVDHGYFKKGSTICFHHTGGLQGVLGHNYMSKYPIDILDKPEYQWLNNAF